MKTVVGGRRLGVRKSKGTGWPLSGSPFSEKNSCKFQEVSCKLHQKAVDRQRFAVLRKEHVLRSRARICSSFLVRAMKQEHQDSDQ